MVLTDVPTIKVVALNVSVTSKGYYLTTIEHILESIVLDVEVVYKVVKVHENAVEEVVGGERIGLIENAIFEPALIEVLKKLLKKYIWFDEKYVGLIVVNILVFERASIIVTVLTVVLIVYPFTASIKDPLIGIAFFVLNDTVAVDDVIV